MAFDSTSNISLSKPSIIFRVNDGYLNITLSKPTISFVVNNWFLRSTVPLITVEMQLSSNFVVNTILPSITIESRFDPNNIYSSSNRLKKPSISFIVVSPNIYSLTTTLPKPTLTGVSDVNITGIVDYRLPLITLNFNVALSASTTKQTWVFNTVTTAHSRYTNYEFDSFFKLGSINYGINNNGAIYNLTGVKDFVGEEAEADINATIILPATSFDEQNLKACSDAFIYGRGNGDMEIQVVLDEQQARTGYLIHFDDREGMHRKRVNPPIPKGLQGNVWQFIIKNIDGSWFDINLFEVFVKTLQRIIKGR